MGLLWNRLTLKGYWRIGKAEAAWLGFLTEEAQKVNANDDVYEMALAA